MDSPILRDLLAKSGTWLTTKGLPNGRREAEWIFADTLGLTRLELYTRWEMPLPEHEVIRLRERIARRGKREPLAYLLGSQPFGPLTLNVGPGVLVPRPETEDLVERALADAGPATRLLDVGTGSGAIALLAKHRRPDLHVEATDASPAALAIAQANALRLALDITFHAGHLATHLPGPYGVVIANLPYIAEDERDACDPELAFEPAEALFAGADGLDLIRPLIHDLPRLAPQGTAWLEHGWRQGAAIAAIAQGLGLASSLHQDDHGHDRFTRSPIP